MIRMIRRLPMPQLVWAGLLVIAVGSIGLIWAASWREFVKESSKSLITAALAGLVIGILVKQYERDRGRQRRQEALSPWLKSWESAEKSLSLYTAYCLATPVQSGSTQDPVQIARKQLSDLTVAVGDLAACLRATSNDEVARNCGAIQKTICRLTSEVYLDESMRERIAKPLRELNRIVPDLRRLGGEFTQFYLSELGDKLDTANYWSSLEQTATEVHALSERLCNSPPTALGQLNPWEVSKVHIQLQGQEITLQLVSLIGLAAEKDARTDLQQD